MERSTDRLWSDCSGLVYDILSLWGQGAIGFNSLSPWSGPSGFHSLHLQASSNFCSSIGRSQYTLLPFSRRRWQYNNDLCIPILLLHLISPFTLPLLALVIVTFYLDQSWVLRYLNTMDAKSHVCTCSCAFTSMCACMHGEARGWRLMSPSITYLSYLKIIIK